MFACSNRWSLGAMLIFNPGANRGSLSSSKTSTRAAYYAIKTSVPRSADTSLPRAEQPISVADLCEALRAIGIASMWPLLTSAFLNVF